MTIVALIRHATYPLLGHAIGGRAPHGLDAAGRAQAEALAARLAIAPFGRVIASPVRRALETAQPLAARHGLAVVPDAAFDEIDYAGWTGASFASLSADPAWLVWNADRATAAVPGGEAMGAVQSRALEGVMQLAAASPGRRIAVVTHADVIKAVLLHALGAPLDSIHRLEIDPASTSTIAVEGATLRVISINLPP